MSLILEALRKSEAERRRGAAPDVHAELAPLPAAGVSGWLRSWRVTLGVLAAIVLATALAWRWTPAPPGADVAPESDQPGAATAGSTAVDASRTPTAGKPARAGGARGADAGAGAEASRLPMVERIDAPPATPAVAQASAPGQSADGTPIPSISIPARPGNAVPAAAQSQSQSRVPASTPAPAPAPAPAATVQTQAPTPAPPTPAPPTPAAARDTDPRPARNAAATTPHADLPTVAELPAEARGRLPAMKLTLHMWNPDPARRFVILDGERRVEGDRLGSARIVTIDSAGVLLELDGRQVRLPLR